MDYQTFLQGKAIKASSDGFVPQWIPDILYPFQVAATEWACKKGRAAIFADCGLGKTLMQLVWIENMRQGSPALIVAPLGVSQQTIDEAKKIGLSVRYVKTQDEMGEGIHITNYERIKSFTPDGIAALVLDESSILKSIDGKTRTYLIREFTSVPFRLCCTATPAPNDISELGNHAEFLGIMKMKEMLATFFVNRAQISSQTWVMKAHGRKHFYKWLASWSLYFADPADIGFPDDRFNLPSLDIGETIVKSGYTQEGMLFPSPVAGLTGRLRARKHSIDERVGVLASKIKASNEQWVVWCGLNTEGQKLHAVLGKDASLLVEGATPPDKKIHHWQTWRDGGAQTLITKPSIFGFGMNFQHCHNMAFLGLGDSYEQYYQAMRRCWRYGQTSPVSVDIITSEAEMAVLDNVKRKERIALQTAKEVIQAMRDYEVLEIQGKDTADTNGGIMTQEKHKNWELTWGDSAEWLQTLDPESVGLSVFSPPFINLYVYTDSQRDIGNNRDDEKYYDHFRYIIKGLIRATKPGRLCCVHVAQVPSIKYVDGFIGVKDYRGRVVSEFVDAGFIYHGEVTIDKNPQVQAIRTKARGLLFASLKKDSSWLRPALADYILVFRKPGENQIPIQPVDVSHEEWIQWAHPVWYDIRETEVLYFRGARGEDDVKHICPLQLEVIERCIKLWSNPGDVVCSPFAGIGSEGYVALQKNRKFVGCELKQEYYNQSIKHLKAAESQYELDVFEKKE